MMTAQRPQNHTMYRSYLVSFMSFRDEMTYDPDQFFTDVELTAITPTDIKRWMKYRAYGDPEPGPDARPTHLRGGSLVVAKKAISFFIPNRLPPWDPGRFSGNPMKSIEINNMLNEVAKHECRAEGAKSMVKRALTRLEFVKALSIFQAKPSFYHQHRIPA
jgi:hypothetical protein